MRQSRSRPAGRDDALAYWSGAPHRTFLAERGGAAVGTYFLTPNQRGGGAHVCNAGFVTAAAHERAGVGRAMLDHALREARDRGFRAMQFNFVLATNERAIRMWRRAGFEEVGRLPGVFEHPARGFVDALVMHRQL